MTAPVELIRRLLHGAGETHHYMSGSSMVPSTAGTLVRGLAHHPLRTAGTARCQAHPQ
jgi:hypothetical protein